MNASTTETIFAGAIASLGSLLNTVIGQVVIVVIALLGLGMAFRYLRRYITGRKF